MARSRMLAAYSLSLIFVGAWCCLLLSCQTNPSGETVSGRSVPKASDAAPPEALHNVHALNARVISGAVPDSDAAFDELRAMGVKTIISVDGATPDVQAAEARGMRYVHIPITYAQVTEAEQLQIARAIRDLPGPVYVHCHHGKHRSPAAVASAGVALGMVSPEEGVAFMKNAGTAPDYEGLYACVATAELLESSVIDAASSDFPSVHKARGMTASMVEADAAFENIGEIRAAGWQTPPTHPDLVPAAEAGRLADTLRVSGEDPDALALGEDFEFRLTKGVRAATALEEAIVRNATREELEAAYTAVNASCKDCHAVYRDRPQQVR